jgi:hypothetical protein
MNIDIRALTAIYWVTVPLMFLIQGDCPIPSVTSTAHPRSSASR